MRSASVCDLEITIQNRALGSLLFLEYFAAKGSNLLDFRDHPTSGILLLWIPIL